MNDKCVSQSKLKCNKCKHIFKRSFYYDKHIIKDKCKQKKYVCKYCNARFTTDNSMYRHMKHSCKIKKHEDNKKNQIFERLIKLEEENKELMKYKDEINELKRKIKKIKHKNNVTNNKIYNSTVNNGTINNIVLIGYGKEDISKINKLEILNSFRKGFYSTIYLTETIHFNPRHPEYHNVYISNIKDKYAMLYDGHEWTLTRKTELIDRLYETKKNYIEDNMEEFIDTLTKSQVKALERWLNTEDEHNKIKEVKDKIKLLLYNKRNIINNNRS